VGGGGGGIVFAFDEIAGVEDEVWGVFLDAVDELVIGGFPFCAGVEIAEVEESEAVELGV
jgi:hypothetical protein